MLCSAFPRHRRIVAAFVSSTFAPKPTKSSTSSAKRAQIKSGSRARRGTGRSSLGRRLSSATPMAVTTKTSIMSGGTFQISTLLEKMTSADKDFRYMATNDLMAELQKDSLTLDDDLERKVVKMLLNLLEDKNAEVQNLAVKCLGPLVSKVKDPQVEAVVDHLCGNMVGSKELLRDISSTSLKTVINELPLTRQALASTVCKSMAGRISAAVAQQGDEAVQLEALEILADLLSRFGGLLVPFHPTLVEAVMPQLKSPRPAVRKRSIAALGYLMMTSDAEQYSKVIDLLLKELSGSDGVTLPNVADARTLVQAAGTVCKQAGHRFGGHVERVVPLVISYAKKGEDDELREHCLQACENMMFKCGKEITPHVQTITDLCLEYICYDPNYNYDDHDDLESMELDDDGSDVSDGEYSDDDDMSWKVRRAAAKCLEAVLSTRHELLPQFYVGVSPALVARFKERQENVKADIFHTYIALLKQTKPAASIKSSDPNLMETTDESSPVCLLQTQVPLLVKAVHKQMREKSVKTRQGCLALLTELISVLPGALSEHVGAVMPGIQYSLSENQSSSNMKIETLTFIGHLLENEQPASVFHPYANLLVPMVTNAVADPFYKISSEALLVLESLVKVLRPLQSPNEEAAPDLKKYVDMIYSCCVQRLRTSDLDQEVKERAISCTGRIAAHLGDLLKRKLPECLPLLQDRLRSEVTRLTAVKALTAIANSRLNIDLKSVLAGSLPVLGEFLRKNQRALKMSTLTLLDTLVRSHASSLSAQSLQPVLTELPSLLSDGDLHVTQLTMVLLASVARLRPDALPTVAASSLPEVFRLAQSPLLQGAALAAMIDLFRALVAAKAPNLGQKSLVETLVNPVMSAEGATIHKQGQASIAKCVSAIVATQAPAEVDAVVKQFSGYLNGTEGVPHQTIFALLVLGEIGRHIDLSKTPELKSLMLTSFGHSSEEVKTVASYALGNLSLGNLQEYLPFVLNEIETQPSKQYLLLHSLKEIISAESCTPGGMAALHPYVDGIWRQLFGHCECAEEGVRNVVAECMGKLCLVEPEKLLPELQRALDSPSALMRTTVVTAMKFTISDQPQAVDALLRDCMGDFLKTLEDADLNVRCKALVALNSAAHNKPSLVRDLLGTVLPHLYNETQVRKELIREVEMGPFKHKVDDGLDLRKAAFECMYTLLDTCLDRIEIFEFLGHVEDGLKDHYDIKMLTYLMVAHASQLCPGAVLTCLDKLIVPLSITVNSKVKPNAVKQEYEKQDELKRSAMRAVTALMNVPGADKHPQMNEFLTQIKSTPELLKLFESVQKDASSVAAAQAAVNGASAVNGNAMDTN